MGFDYGWIGVGYEDSSFYFNHVFHKFSYPAVTDFFDTSKHYNGDTLYYQYGNVEMIKFANKENIIIPNTWGVPGQSGSSIYYSDNTDYFSSGVLSTSTGLRHEKISQKMFYQLENIIQNYSEYNALTHTQNAIQKLKIYPNPIYDGATIEFSNPGNNSYMLEIYDSQGRRCFYEKDIHSGQIQIERQSLHPGLYFVKPSSEKGNVFTGKLIVAQAE